MSESIFSFVGKGVSSVGKTVAAAGAAAQKNQAKNNPTRKIASSAPTTGLLAKTKSGQIVRLSGPVRPYRVGNKVVQPSSYMQPGVLSPASGTRITGKPTTASVAGGGSAARTPAGPKLGIRNLGGVPLTAEQSGWLDTLRKQSAANAKANADANRGSMQDDTPWGWLAEKAGNFLGGAVQFAESPAVIGAEALKQVVDLSIASSPAINAYNPGLAKKSATRAKKRYVRDAVAPAEAYKQKYVDPFLDGGGGAKQLFDNMGNDTFGTTLDVLGLASAGTGAIGKGMTAAAKGAAWYDATQSARAARSAGAGGATNVKMGGAAKAGKWARGYLTHADRATTKMPGRQYNPNSPDYVVRPKGSPPPPPGAPQPIARVGKVDIYPAQGVQPGRIRGPKIVKPPELTPSGDAMPSMPVIEVPRGPRGGNPVTNAALKKIDAVSTAVGEKVNPLGEPMFKAPDFLARAFGNLPQSRYESAIKKRSTEDAYGAQEAIDRFMADNMAGVVKARNKVPRSQRELADAATWLRVKGLNVVDKPSGFTDRNWGRNEYLNMWSKELEGLKASGDKTTLPTQQHISQNIELLKSIPDEWLDPATAPAVINNYVAAAIRTSSKTQAVAQDTTGISAPTATGSQTRAQAVALGAKPLGEVIGGYNSLIDRAISMRDNGSGGQATRGAKLVPRLRNRRDQIELNTLVDNPQYLQALDRMNRAQSAVDQFRGTPMNSKQIAAVNELTEAKASFTNIREKAVASAWRPGRRPADLPLGNYLKDVSPLRGSGYTQPGLSSNPLAMGPPRIKMSKGVLLRQGTVALNPLESLVSQVNTAARMYAGSRRVSKFIDDNVVRSEVSGSPLVGKKAELAAKNSRGLYVAKPVDSLIEMMDLAGTPLATQLRESIAKELGEGEPHVILMPKAALDAWSSVTRAGRVKGLDAATNAFKGSVLVTSPRWYFQNIIGQWGHFFLQAGPDIVSMQLARNPEFRRAIPDIIHENKFSANILSQKQLDSGITGQGAVAKAAKWAYSFNARFEQVPRLAAYAHSLKKGMRDNSILAGRFMSEGEVMDGLKYLTDGAARGEKWAEDIIDQAIKESMFFQGDYVRFNTFERAFLKRFFPFYAWMRTVVRLALKLPFKYPKRTALLNVAATMAQELWSLDEAERYWGKLGTFAFGRYWDLGSYNSGSFIVEGASPVRDMLNQGTIDPGEMIAALMGTLAPSANPVIAMFFNTASNQTSLGTPMTEPPGYQGVYQAPGGGKYRYNAATGTVDYAQQYVSPTAQALNTNSWSRLASQALLGGKPLSTTTPFGALAYRAGVGEPADYMQAPPKYAKPLEEDKWTAITRIFGAPAYKPNVRALIDQQAARAQSWWNGANSAYKSRYNTNARRP